VTYGSQLQAYFSRIFPDLLGPTVLGVPPVPAPRFLADDPWPGFLQPPRPAGDARRAWDESSVRCRLGGDLSPAYARDGTVPLVRDNPRWRNLWRATDFLGFPVDQGRWDDADGPIDFGCQEADLTGYQPAVGAHSDYPRMPAYVGALLDLQTVLLRDGRAR